MPQTIGYTVLGLGFGWLVLAAWYGQPTVLGFIFERPWLRHLGKRSYAIYILHIPILTVFHSVYKSVLARTDRDGRDVLLLVLAFLVVIVAAELSWHCYEKQFLKLKKYFPRADV
ncbi:MAG: hypothetical protein O3C40_26795 [Planctomycetota bacterium]|nr:hypothetical protein [Planctomycetota bacterium]